MKEDKTKNQKEKNGQFHLLKIKAGKLFQYDDGNYNTLITGFVPKSKVELPSGYTHFGVIVSGKITVAYTYKKIKRERVFVEGDFFSIVGMAEIKSSGMGMVSSAKKYVGMNVFGGPLEEKGRLRYIDGCTDSLLIPPVRLGDPCLNHLHFPKNIVQTQHDHPSARTGLIYKGRGECVLSDKRVPLVPGYAFVLETGTLHSFDTSNSTMDVIAFHPDSDVGVTDDNHPMVNRTMVGGVSSNKISKIRTKKA